MSAKPPPIPPASRSSKGIGDAGQAGADDTLKKADDAADPDREGQQGNSKINTTHQGYQQDR